jgi:hypothetical protein
MVGDRVSACAEEAGVPAMKTARAAAARVGIPFFIDQGPFVYAQRNTRCARRRQAGCENRNSLRLSSPMQRLDRQCALIQ